MPTILDHEGRPLRVQDLREPQTSHLASLRRELQSHPTRGLTPSKLAAILDAAENGDLVAQFELFEDMEEKDAHIASEMGKRRRALLVDWEVVPPDNPSVSEKRTAEQLGELLLEVPDFEDMLFDLTDAIGKSFVCLELEWHRPGRWWIPKTITHRPQSWFQLHRGYRQELRLRTPVVIDGVPGETLQPFGWITHIHKAKSGYLERSALFRQLVWTYLFKNYSVGDLAEFLEIYGIPLRVGKYPSSASDQEKATLLRALKGIGHNAAGIVPDGMLLEFHKAAQGDPAAFALMIDWCEKNQSKVILGGTLTSGADGKSSTNALGNVHNEVRKDLRDSDIRQVNTTLSRDLVYAIAAVNGLAPDGIRRSPVFRLNAQELENLATFASSLPQLVDLGFEVPRQWAQEKLGIPQREGNEPVLQSKAKLPPAEPRVPGPGGAVPGARPVPAANDEGDTATEPATQDAAVAAAVARAWGYAGAAGLAAASTMRAVATMTPPELMAGRLSQDLAPAVGQWIDEIRALVDRATSLEEIRDGLEELLPGMSLDQYAAAMAQAMSAAQLAGRYEVLREAGGTGL
ncbi:DUF935 domain-containing protein [Variovorax sp.]|uniref:DUF935 domain-containing protein n=1 Tax=Variovorax sp. TaxID=1871043 RepID=UPI003BAAE59E